MNNKFNPLNEDTTGKSSSLRKKNLIQCQKKIAKRQKEKKILLHTEKSFAYEAKKKLNKKRQIKN